jgi:hypothetical protein
MSNLTDNFCFTKSNENNCNQELKNITSVDACIEVQNQIDLLTQIVKTIGEDFSITGIINAIGSSNKSNQKIKSIINNFQETIQISNLYENCQSISNTVQINRIGSEKCADKQNEIINILKQYPNELNKYLSHINIFNVNQINTNEVSQQCVLSGILNSLSTQDVSIESVALIKLLQHSSNFLASNNNFQNLCQITDNTQSTCQYLNTVLCCSNTADVIQQNIIECVGTSNIQQLNSNKIFQTCNLIGTTTLNSSIISKLNNSASLSSLQKAIGYNFLEFLFLLLIPFIAICIFSIFTYKFSKNIFKYIGFLPLCFGTILILLYYTFSPGKLGQIIKDKPLTGDTENCPSNIYYSNISISYKNSFDICNLDTDCIAFDFSFQKNIVIENENIIGTAIYYYDVSKICDTDSNDLKNNYYTVYKNIKSVKIYYVYIGNVFIIFGLILIGFLNYKK